MLQSRGHFGAIFADLGLQRGPCSSLFSQNLQILNEKNSVEIEARKKMTFGRLCAGDGGRGGACLAMQILQNQLWISSRPASPSGVRRIYRLPPLPPISPVLDDLMI